MKTENLLPNRRNPGPEAATRTPADAAVDLDPLSLVGRDTSARGKASTHHRNPNTMPVSQARFAAPKPRDETSEPSFASRGSERSSRHMPRPELSGGSPSRQVDSFASSSQGDLPRGPRGTQVGPSCATDARSISQRATALRTGGRWPEADEVLARGLKQHPHEIVLWNQRLDLYKRDPRLTKLWDDMQSAGVRPDVFTYSILIGALGKAGDTEGAREAFQDMKRTGVRPNVVTYNTLIDALGKAGDTESARQAFKDMEHAGVRPNVVTYNTLIDALGKAGDTERMWGMFKDMEHAGVRPNVVTYNALIDTLGKAGDIERARQAFEGMEHAGVCPNEVTYNTLIDALGKAGDIKRVREAFDDLQHAGLRPDVVTYNTLIDALAKAGDIKAAREAFQDMEHAGVHPSVITYNILIDALGKAGDIKRARKAFKDMDSTGVRPDVVSYNTLIDALGKAGDIKRVREAFKAMQRAGVHPNVVTYNAIISVLGMAGDAEKAWEAFKDMEPAGVCPNEVTYNTLIDAFYRAAQWQLGINAVAHLPLPAKAQSGLAELYRKARQYEAALALCGRILENEPRSSDAYAHAWIVRLCVLMHTDRPQFLQLHSRPPFDDASVHTVRLVCARVFGGVITPGTVAATNAMAMLVETGGQDLGDAARRDVNRAMRMLSPY